MPTRTAIARNFAEASENRIHSDDIAKRFGFTGALVPGVTVFGHLTAPVNQRYGARWLERGWATTRFQKPAYDGESISLIDREPDSQRMSVECRNAADVLLATLECTLESTQPPVDPRSAVRGRSGDVARVEIGWDTVHVDSPLATYVWAPDHGQNREYAAQVDDTSALFQEGVLHPHALLAQANRVLVRQFVMPAWIHTGSELRCRKLLRVGDEIEVRSVPVEKWEKKGHQFVKLYIAYLVRGEVATEILHTAIFRVAER